LSARLFGSIAAEMPGQPGGELAEREIGIATPGVGHQAAVAVVRDGAQRQGAIARQRFEAQARGMPPGLLTLWRVDACQPDLEQPACVVAHLERVTVQDARRMPDQVRPAVAEALVLDPDSRLGCGLIDSDLCRIRSSRS
jgi:hypothetical protein